MRYCGLSSVQQVGYSFFFGRLTSVATIPFQVLFFSLMYNAVAHILCGLLMYCLLSSPAV